MFSGLDIFFSLATRSCLFICIYNTIRTIEFTMPWIYFRAKVGLGIFFFKFKSSSSFLKNQMVAP